MLRHFPCRRAQIGDILHLEGPHALVPAGACWLAQCWSFSSSSVLLPLPSAQELTASKSFRCGGITLFARSNPLGDLSWNQALSAYNVEQHFFPSDGSQNVTSVPLKIVFVRGPFNFHFLARIWLKYDQWISSWVPLQLPQRPAIRNVFSLCGAIVVQVAETFGGVLFQWLSRNSKKKFRRSKKTDSSFLDV